MPKYQTASMKPKAEAGQCGQCTGCCMKAFVGMHDSVEDIRVG